MKMRIEFTYDFDDEELKAVRFAYEDAKAEGYAEGETFREWVKSHAPSSFYGWINSREQEYNREQKYLEQNQ